MKKVCLLLLFVINFVSFSYCINSRVLIASQHLFRVGLDVSQTTTGLDSIITSTGIDYTITSTCSMKSP